MAVKMVPQCSDCNKTVFQEKLDSDKPGADLILVVTKCGHVFEQTCLQTWLQKSNICPIDNQPITFPECRPIENILEVFGALYKLDSTFVLKCLQEMLKDEPEQICSICHKEFLPIFLISSEKLMHQECWNQKNPKAETRPISLVPQQIATISQKGIQTYPKLAKLLPALPSSALAGLPGPSDPGKPPASSPRKPSRSISPALIVTLAVAPIISLWAYAMNTRIYRNQNPLLFVLSIPVILVVKTFSALRFALKRMFA
jgi:hypothetical protein